MHILSSDSSSEALCCRCLCQEIWAHCPVMLVTFSLVSKRFCVGRSFFHHRSKICDEKFLPRGIFRSVGNSERCTGTICDFCAFGSMLNSHYTKTLMKEEENKFRFSSKSDRDQRTAKCKKHKVSLLISCIKDSCEQRKEETHEVETG